MRVNGDVIKFVDTMYRQRYYGPIIRGGQQHIGSTWTGGADWLRLFWRAVLKFDKTAIPKVKLQVTQLAPVLGGESARLRITRVIFKKKTGRVSALPARRGAQDALRGPDG